ncbi:unnamed protein product [Caretta caretta]
MIAAAFLVLLRPYSIQCALFLLLLLLGTIATILFFCCWHRKLQKGRHPIKSVLSGRSRSRDAVMRTHHCRSEVIYLARNFKGFRPSPRHARRRVAPRLEETQPLAEVHHLSEQETSIRKRKIKKNSRVQPEFYHSVQVTPTRKPEFVLEDISLLRVRSGAVVEIFYKIRCDWDKVLLNCDSTKIEMLNSVPKDFYYFSATL